MRNWGQDRISANWAALIHSPARITATTDDCKGPAASPDPGGHADLVQELRNGNPQVFTWVYATLRSPLLAYARSYLPGAEEAEDVVQDAFLRLWTHRDCLRSEGSVKALLFATVRSKSIDVQRRGTHRRVLVGRVPVPSPVPSPCEELQALELSEVADKAIRRLCERKLSYKEVAATLGISPQTVANTMSSALSDLRAALVSGAA